MNRKAEIESLVKQAETFRAAFSPDSHQAPLIAKIHMIIAEEQSEAADKFTGHVEKLTRQTDVMIAESKRLGRLTWALIFLTVGLLFLTGGLLWIDWHREVPAVQGH